MATARYELREELGAGTSGAVYRAYDHALGREVAVKLMHAARLDPDTQKRLEREARVAASFRHPNAVEVYELGTLDGRPFLAMELVAGRPMADAILEPHPPVSPGAIAAIGRALADVLAAAHAIGLVHRDVKPGNIFLEGSLEAPARLRLVDFGLAFHTNPRSATLGRLTAEGAVVGTPAYMAPEQAEGTAVGPPADVYALGCILYELASGRPPFVGTLSKILTGHLYLPPIPLAEQGIEIPRPLETLIFAMLEKAPADRPTAAGVGEALASMDLAGARSNSAGRTRAERQVHAPRAIDASAATLPVTETPVKIGVLGALHLDDALIAEALVAPVPPPLAEVLVAQLDDRGNVLVGTPPPGVPIVGVHAAPTPPLIARAIRNGISAVAPWPPTPAVLRARVLAARGGGR